MGWTKRQFIEAAFDEIGIASYAFDISPGQFQAALRKLDAMMAEFNARGIRLAYPLPGTPDGSDLDSLTDVPDGAVSTVVLQLAIRLAPSYGRPVMPETKSNAARALESIMAQQAAPKEMDFPQTCPIGAGNKQFNQWWSPFVRPPQVYVDAGGDGPIEYD